MKNTSLIFDWPVRHRIHLLLPAMLLLAALVHGSLFFVFTIAYPKGTPDTLKPAQLFFLPDGSPQKSQVEGLLLSSDPSLFAPGRGLPREESLFSTAYTPQFSSEKPAILPPTRRVESSPPAHIPSLRRDVKFSTPPLPKMEAAPLPARLHSGPALADRLPTLPATPLVSSIASAPLETATFLIGVDSDGSVAFLIPEKSSGDPTIDRELLRLLRGLRFAPAGKNGIVWDFLEFQCGSEPNPQKKP